MQGYEKKATRSLNQLVMNENRMMYNEYNGNWGYADVVLHAKQKKNRLKHGISWTNNSDSFNYPIF